MKAFVMVVALVFASSITRADDAAVADVVYKPAGSAVGVTFNGCAVASAQPHLNASLQWTCTSGYTFASGILTIPSGVAVTNGTGSITLTDAVTAAVTDLLTIDHESSGTPAAGFGTGFVFKGESDTTAAQDMGRVSSLWTTATHASRTSNMVFSVVSAGSVTESFRALPLSIAVGGADGAANTITTLAGSGIYFEGSSADVNETLFTAANATADTTWQIPAASAGTYTIAAINLAQGWTAIQTFNGDVGFEVGSGQALVRVDTTHTPDTPSLYTGTTANAWKIAERADESFDFQGAACGTSACITPTLSIHSADQVTDEWISAYADANGLGHLYGSKGLVLEGAATKTLTDGAATAFVQLAVASGSYVGGIITYTVQAVDGSTQQARSGQVPFVAVNEGGTETCQIDTADADEVEVSPTGAMTLAFSCADGGTNLINLEANANSDFAAPTVVIKYGVRITSGTTTVTPQ